MSRLSTALAAIEPAPASERRAAGARPGVRDAMQVVRARRDPRDAAALLEAGALYANDENGAHELEDIEAGRHPLQRDGRSLDAWPNFEAKLAAIRARRGI